MPSLPRPLRGGVLSAPGPCRPARGSGAIPRKGGSPMRNYELAFIADPDLDENALTALEEKIKGWVEAAGGSMVKVDRWGKRRMAYTIKKRHDGHYFFVTATLPTQAGAELERNLRLTEQVLRFMITLQEAA
ncbi:MAG: 30S ribosomal protein S6 [Chloroflexi bacterium]|nr:30S ribosomal protein S6 [Chloroflexota bacterium]